MTRSARNRSTRAKGLRIVGGTLRGRRVLSAEGSRPTQERVREALFSRWQDRIDGATFLDLFCGGGAVAVEALSRGAGASFLVDSAGRSLRMVASNLEQLGLRAEAVRLQLPDQWNRLPATWPSAFDLIFTDPPYTLPNLEEVVRVAAKRLLDTGELALEHDVRREVVTPPGLELVGSRRYGETSLSFYRKRATL